MPTRRQIAKATAKTLLTLSLLATYFAKYGVDLSANVSRTIMKSTDTMTDFFVGDKVPRLGIGDAMFDKTVAATDWTLNKAIQIQKDLRQRV